MYFLIVRHPVVKLLAVGVTSTILSACLSGAASRPGAVLPRPTAAPSGKLQLVEMTPMPGTVLTEESTIHAVFEYAVETFHADKKYGIAPLFGDKRRAGATFTALPRLTDALQLTSPQGRAELRYRIANEWRSDRLMQPISLWFYLVEVEEPTGKSNVISVAGPYNFGTHGHP